MASLTSASWSAESAIEKRGAAGSPRGRVRRRNRSAQEWNVPTKERRDARPRSFWARSRISSAALFVNVTADDRARVGAALDEARQAVRDDPGLARAGAGEDEERALVVEDGLASVRDSARRAAGQYRESSDVRGIIDRHSTVTDFARFRGWSTSHPRRTATWYARSWSGTTEMIGWSSGIVSGMTMT